MRGHIGDMPRTKGVIEYEMGRYEFIENPRLLPLPAVLRRSCEHCYCEDHSWKKDHAQCCKCGEHKHRKFIATNAGGT